PIILQDVGTMSLPLSGLFRKKRNLPAYLWDVADHCRWSHLCRRVDTIFYTYRRHPRILRLSYRGEVKRVLVGSDHEDWSRECTRAEAKRKLGIAEETFVFLSVSRLTSLKQIDRLIVSLRRVRSERPWVLFLAGHGTREYEAFLRRLAEPLLREGKVRFAGYVPRNELKLLYSAADVFVNSSMQEGGPISAMQAALMETPILTTDSGHVQEYLAQEGCGVVVGRKDYAAWTGVLQGILDGEPVRPLPLEKARRRYGWSYVIEDYIREYRALAERG
ncbi:MAG TPA: glycosyltransferase, partial [Bacteroidetes bacterium]|nr:glycosyltransferase [Bacteroidota bacterium]